MAETSLNTDESKTEKKQKHGKNSEESAHKILKFRQYFAGFAACVGGFQIGNIIGWPSPASTMLVQFEQSYKWIASIMIVGAIFSQILTSLLIEIIGRKLTMIFLVVFTFFTWIGYCVLPINEEFLLFMRFFHGFFAGGFVMVCPIFIGEITHTSTRGCLIVYFQVMISIGLFYSSIFCLTDNFLVFSIFEVLPALLGVLYPCVKESPIYLMKIGKEEKAKESLEFYRGNHYDTASEMEEIKRVAAKTNISYCKALKQKASIKSFYMLLGMHTIQQLSGINTIIFYAREILKDSGELQCVLLIVLSAFQVIVSIVIAHVVDKVGRRILWLISLTIITVTLIACGIYFYFENTSTLIFGIIIYIHIAGFAVGAGPLPWTMLGELIPTRVKAFIACIVCMINWFCAFAVTVSFDDLAQLIGLSNIFFIHSIITAAGILFILFCVIETKGKSLDDIQGELTNGKVQPTLSGN